jgi:hypothetical protein
VHGRNAKSVEVEIWLREDLIARSFERGSSPNAARQWNTAPAARERVQAALASGTVTPVVTVESHTVRETPDGRFTPKGV